MYIVIIHDMTVQWESKEKTLQYYKYIFTQKCQSANLSISYCSKKQQGPFDWVQTHA